MLLFHLSLITALLHCIAQSVASSLPSPLPNPPLTRRDRYCANAPTVKAGNHLDRRSTLSSVLLPRESTRILWCCPHTNTFIIIVTNHVIPPSASGIYNDVLATLYTAWDIARTQIHQNGDRIIGENGYYAVVGDGGIRLSTWNTNNHQLTFGVFSSAVMALMNYMRVKDWYGSVTFDIYDGVNKIATAFLA